MNPPFDPVRLHFLDALARRAHGHEGAVKRLLEDKLSRARAAYQERLAQMSLESLGSSINRSAQHPISHTQHSALAELTRALTQHVPKLAQAGTPANGDARDDGNDASMGSRPELKSMRYFRKTWSKLSVDKQLAQAIEQGPENAGPLNSHQLVLRSLSLMRDLSPAYLNRFMSYADALLWLEQADSKPALKSSANPESGKKRKVRRAGTR